MTLKVLHLAKRENHRLRQIARGVNISLTSVNKYDLRLKCTLFRHRCPALAVPGSRLVQVNSFIRILSRLTFRLFSENILHKRVAPLPLLFSKLIIKYLSSTADPIVGEQIYTTPKLTMSSTPTNIYSSIQ